MADPLPRAITRLIEELGRLPTIGPKTAQRLAFFLLRSPEASVSTLGHAILALRDGIRPCSTCSMYTDQDPCPICADPTRQQSLVCVVEDTLDLLAIERSGGYRGVYHVLQGVISPLDGVGPDDLTVAALERRVRAGVIGEVIVATNASIEGDATAMEIQHRLASDTVRVSRLARGLATGGDLEYVDAATIAQALEGRREF
ncbi:MAG: recombination protein RecR [Actinobacteria bacterium]|nr:recombination protein RecR [Actinomycetota bacterium]